MNLKKLGTVPVVVLAVCALAVSSASAAAATEDVTWTVEGTTISSPAGVSATGSGGFTTTVGTTPIEFNTGGVNCLFCTIENSGGTAIGKGSLEFTSVTVKTPATCKVNGGKVTTVPLKFKVDYMIGTSSYILFEPMTGTQFGEVKLEKGTGACAISGSYIISGKIFGKISNGTGVDEVNQTVTFSGGINKEASGEEKPLLFGGAAAVKNGSITFALTGANAGKKFGTK